MWILLVESEVESYNLNSSSKCEKLVLFIQGRMFGGWEWGDLFLCFLPLFSSKRLSETCLVW